MVVLGGFNHCLGHQIGFHYDWRDRYFLRFALVFDGVD